MTLLSSFLSAPLLGASLGIGPSPYPIPPRPLRILCEDAELIVYAHVSRVEGGAPSIATLEIESVLHGVSKSSEISVSFNPLVICPEPAVYTEETSVLAFLRWDEERALYHTVNLSYGVKELEEEGRRVYALAIKEYFSICDRELEIEQRDELVLSWLVGLAENPITRWEGAFDLALHTRWESTQPDSRLSLFAQRLTAPQIGRLQSVIRAEENLVDEGNLCLIRLLNELGAPDLPAVLLKYLIACKADDEFDSYSSLDELMMMVATASNNAEAITIAKEHAQIILVASSSVWEEREKEREVLYRKGLQEFLAAMRE